MNEYSAKLRQRADGMRIVTVFCLPCSERHGEGWMNRDGTERFDAGEPYKCPRCGSEKVSCEVLPEERKE